MKLDSRSYVAVRAAALRKWLQENERSWSVADRDAFHAGYNAANERYESIAAAYQRYADDLERDLKAARAELAALREGAG